MNEDEILQAITDARAEFAEQQPDALDMEREKCYCPWCFEEFDFEEELDAHEQECEAYFPWKGGN